MLLGRFLILAGTFAIIFLYTKFPSRATVFLRVLFQMSLLSYWYPDTFEFNRIFPNLDHLFASMDFSLFGCQPAIEFEKVCGSLFWREAFNMGYWLYYPMIAVISVYYFFARPKEAERCTFIIIASFFIYYFIYMFLPVAGVYPEIRNYFNLHPEISIAQEGKGGLFTELVGMAQSAGERPTAAFPSSHIGVTTIIVILAYRAKKWLFAAMFPVYLLLCCATVYIKAHYLVDAIGGVITGVLFYMLTSWLYKKWFRE